MALFKTNCCDGVYNSYDVHFTSACDNKCAHCIDSCFVGLNLIKPDPVAIANTILEAKDKLDDVLFLGGEPCLYLKELIECIDIIRAHSNLKIYVTTSVPKTLYDNHELFNELVEKLDGINLSVQHYKEEIADEIRKTKSKFDRQKFYRNFPHKEKVRINLNIVKPYLCTKDEICECLLHYNKLGFNDIKLSEIQHGKEYFVSFEKLFDIKLKSAFARGCQTVVDMKPFIPEFSGRLLLKRSCFLCEETLKAKPIDLVKSIYKVLAPPAKNTYGVVYEDGTLSNGWI